MESSRFSPPGATVEFRPEGAGTRLVFTEQGAYFEGREAVASREEGTVGMLESLADEVARPTSPA